MLPTPTDMIQIGGRKLADMKGGAAAAQLGQAPGSQAVTVPFGQRR